MTGESAPMSYTEALLAISTLRAQVAQLAAVCAELGRVVADHLNDDTSHGGAPARRLRAVANGDDR